MQSRQSAVEEKDKDALGLGEAGRPSLRGWHIVIGLKFRIYPTQTLVPRIGALWTLHNVVG